MTGGGIAKQPEAQDFSFDDSVFSPLEVRDTDLRLLDFVVPDDLGTAAEVVNGPMIAELGDLQAGAPSRRSALHFFSDRITSRGLTLALGFFGLTFLLGALLFYSLRSGTGGSDLLAQWRSSLAALKPASTGSRDLPAPPPPVVPARIVVPALSRPQFARAKKIAPPPAPAPAPAPATKPPAQRSSVVPGNPAPAKAAAPPAQPDAGDEDEALLGLAKEFSLLGDRNKAEQIYLRLVQEQRQAGRAALALGGLYMEQERFAEAYQMYERSKQFYNDEGGSAKSGQ